MGSLGLNIKHVFTGSDYIFIERFLKDKLNQR
jgi:hypothetical protein